MSNFPTDQGMLFLICDDFRHEGDGKLSIFGIIGDNIQVIPPPPGQKIVLKSLGLYIAFRDGDGNFQMSIELTSPDKKVLIPGGNKQPVVKVSDGWMNVALKLEPFQGEVGDYTLIISLTNEQNKETKYKRIFSIKHRVTH